MAIIENNPYLVGARGMHGDTVYRQLRGRTISQRRPIPTTLESPVQKENRSQFAEASAYAKGAMLDPQLKEQYREEPKRLKLPNPYTAALTLKLRDLKAVPYEAEEIGLFNEDGTPQSLPRVHPPEPFKNMDLKEYMLNSTTTGKGFRRKHNATSPRSPIRPSPEMIERLLDKPKHPTDGQLFLFNDTQ